MRDPLQSKPSKTMSYTNYFADALTAEARADSRIIAVHAAMAGGTGLTRWVVSRLRELAVFVL